MHYGELHLWRNVMLAPCLLSSTQNGNCRRHRKFFLQSLIGDKEECRCHRVFSFIADWGVSQCNNLNLPNHNCKAKQAIFIRWKFARLINLILSSSFGLFHSVLFKQKQTKWFGNFACNRKSLVVVGRFWCQSRGQYRIHEFGSSQSFWDTPI